MMLSCFIDVIEVTVLHTLVLAVQRYLDETLGISVPAYQPWKRAQDLPYFLQDAFDFWEVQFLGQTVVLAMDRGHGVSTTGEIKLRLEKLDEISGQRSVFVTDALASYERKRLVEQKVPFIVPGNQLYLPDLGVDLREYFRQRAKPMHSQLSPSAQAMLIRQLLRPDWENEWHPSASAAELGYTPMTVSRTVRELTAAGIARAEKSGRTQYLKMEFSPQETWDRIKPMLCNPVQRVVWLPESAIERDRMRLAGLSALAQYSMLAAPKHEIYAVKRTFRKSVDTDLESPEPRSGYIECQQWNYSPALQPASDSVDPLSLALSLQGNPDERIQSALDELREALPW